MYARVTTLSVKAESFAEADALSAEITVDAMAIPGIKHFFRGSNT